MAASGSLAGSTGSWAPLWAAGQACHMESLARQDPGRASVGLAAAPLVSKDKGATLGPGASGRCAWRCKGPGEMPGASRKLIVLKLTAWSSASICHMGETPKVSSKLI